MLDSRLIAIVRFHDGGDVDGAVAPRSGAATVGLGGELVGRAPPRTDADLESTVARPVRALAAAINEQEGSG